MITCPRGHGLLVFKCGLEGQRGRFCLLCDYEEGGDDFPDLEAEVMAAVPGGPLERDEEQRIRKLKATVQERRADELQLAEEAAARHGVSLEDVQKPLLGWRNMHPSIRFALQSVICDLTIEGLGIRRIATVLKKHYNTIAKNPGVYRGRARRIHD